MSKVTLEHWIGCSARQCFLNLVFALALSMFGIGGDDVFAEEQKSYFTNDRWRAIVDDGKKAEERIYDVNRDFATGETDSREHVDRLIQRTSTGDEENVPIVTFQKVPKLKEKKSEAQIDEKNSEKAFVKEDALPKRKRIIIEEPDVKVRAEPLGITRAREMIDELDIEKAKRLKILKSPIGRKKGLPGAPVMPPPGKSTR